MADWDRRFREANDWAGWHGYAAAWPNFHEADYGDGVVYGTFLLPGATVEWRDVPRTEYGVFHIEDVPGMFRGANDYAAANGYAAGLPTFHQADYGQGVVYGTTLSKPGTVEFRDVPATTLGVFDRRNAPAMMRAASDYAAANGFAAAFPTFHEADYGAGLVFGLILFHPVSATWRDVPADLLRGYSDPTWPLAVVLCRPSDVPAGPRARWVDMFVPGGSDPSNVTRYWAEVSHGRYDGAGTMVSGWIDIGHTMAEVSALSGQAQRRQLADWGRQAAAAAGVRLGDFRQVVFGYNIDADHGSVGGNTVVLAYRDARAFEPTFFFHEVGHTLGLGHSSSDGDGVYGNRFDIMSAMNVWTIPDPLGRAAGPGPAAINLENLGWLHRSRVWRSFPVTPQVVELAALNAVSLDGYVAARVGLPLIGTTYTVELRAATGWDAGFPGHRVLVHSRNGENGPEILGTGWNPIGALSAGQDLVLRGSLLPMVVRVERIAPDGSGARVRVWMLPASGARSVRVAAIVYDPPGVDWHNEHVVVRNDSTSVVDIGGWRLSDRAGHTFQIPAGQSLSPGQDVRIWTGPGVDGPTDVHMGRRAAVWNNHGDTATLRDVAGTTVSTYAYGNGGA